MILYSNSTHPLTWTWTPILTRPDPNINSILDSDLSRGRAKGRELGAESRWRVGSRVGFELGLGTRSNLELGSRVRPRLKLVDSFGSWLGSRLIVGSQVESRLVQCLESVSNWDRGAERVESQVGGFESSLKLGLGLGEIGSWFIVESLVGVRSGTRSRLDGEIEREF
ncbi:hypothetical protein HAX54_048912 [Datura stramonium]|uniref:Uncharacterized protein n=1 Tax=Datura stramonium TaxID=4076 RepID=A0ABS8WME6_DATST|nr:hypothetical protein [Datura stramonium]